MFLPNEVPPTCGVSEKKRWKHEIWYHGHSLVFMVDTDNSYAMMDSRRQTMPWVQGLA